MQFERIHIRQWSTKQEVLGWGVGGIEAEAAMLGVPLVWQCPMLSQEIIGQLTEGVTATDVA